MPPLESGSPHGPFQGWALSSCISFGFACTNLQGPPHTQNKGTGDKCGFSQNVHLHPCCHGEFILQQKLVEPIGQGSRESTVRYTGKIVGATGKERFPGGGLGGKSQSPGAPLTEVAREEEALILAIPGGPVAVCSCSSWQEALPRRL